MSDAQEYTLRWRGRESGPYPIAEINRQLDEHEIGMGHEIHCQDKWITLEEFFASLREAVPPAPPPDPPPPVARPALAVAAPPPPGGAKPARGFSPVRIKVSVSSPATPPKAKTDGAGRVLQPRYRMIFALLAAGAGFLGVHNFYARQWLTGLLQLLLSIATYLMGFGIIASWLWAMVEAVIVRKDGDDIDMI